MNTLAGSEGFLREAEGSKHHLLASAWKRRSGIFHLVACLFGCSVLFLGQTQRNWRNNIKMEQLGWVFLITARLPGQHELSFRQTKIIGQKRRKLNAVAVHNKSVGVQTGHH